MAFARRHPVVLVLLILLLLVLGILGASAMAVWRAAHTDEASRVDSADVILVLGAAQYAGRPSPVFRGRLEHGGLLYRKRFSERILVLGAGRP
ncbi:MAG TPA: YdcF family protein, partial [Actinomycetota bacterium]|nr:YdcF family protein [Actinomycetota bacterium]